MGTRFVASEEASSHIAFKQLVTGSQEGDTMLSMKNLVPVRLLRNSFFTAVAAAESRGATREELQQLLGRGRAKKGMFEGDMEEGELEIGQVAALVKDIRPAGQIVQETWQEFEEACRNPFRII
jgi:enoyl-[acyl-carrier protein] reductase II